MSHKKCMMCENIDVLLQAQGSSSFAASLPKIVPLCCWCYIDSTIIIVVIIITFMMKRKYSFRPVIALDKQRKTRFCARNEKQHIAVYQKQRELSVTNQFLTALVDSMKSWVSHSFIPENQPFFNKLKIYIRLVFMP